MAKENPKNSGQTPTDEILAELSQLPNLPSDSPFRVKYITDVDCMIALATTKKNFDSHYKKHLDGWTRKGHWTLTTLEDFERMMIRVDQERKESKTRVVD